MALKKNDKLIALIGVIILIVAGLGIVLYVGNDKEKGVPPIQEQNPIKTFEVNYKEVSVPIFPDNTVYSIKPKLIGQGKYIGNIVLQEQNLKSLDIMIQYRDNFCGFFFGRIFRNIGADTLTITVSKEGQEVAKDSIKGDGKIILPYISIGSIIPNLTIEAKDIDAAKAILEGQYIDYNITYNIQIALKTGLWKKFVELLGRDKFNLTVNYTQFVYNITNPVDNSTDNNPPTDSYEGGTLTWAAMSYPGKN